MADAIMRKFPLQLLGNASAILGNYPLQKTIIDYLKMLLNDKNLEEEIKEVFDSYDNRNLFVEIY